MSPLTLGCIVSLHELDSKTKFTALKTNKRLHKATGSPYRFSLFLQIWTARQLEESSQMAVAISPEDLTIEHRDELAIKIYRGLQLRRA